MRSTTKKSISIAAIVLSALAFEACGDSHTRVTTGTYAGESGLNAPYLNVGPLVYEVQLSRELNPADTEDSAYLRGLTPQQSKLEPGQEWFAVFLQVYNQTNSSEPSASSLTITDTQGNTYTPLLPNNEFAYRAGHVPSDGRLPELNTVAANGPTQGALLLYKIKVESLDNRPLQLKIIDPQDASQSASAELDV